jgi:tRNA 2-thiocytidine biosynthesis protein TtcA
MADGVAKEDGDKAFDDEPIQNKQFVAPSDYEDGNSGVQSINIKQLA